MTRQRLKRRRLYELYEAAFIIGIVLLPRSLVANTIPLMTEHGELHEGVLETFLSPGEFPDRTIQYTLTGDEALYAMDLGLSAQKPLATFHPDRIVFPTIAELPLILENSPIPLDIISPNATDAHLDKGFSIRLNMAPLGQRFSPPRFVARLISVTLSANDHEPLLTWSRKKKPAVCHAENADKSTPTCAVDNVGLEARSLAISPDGGKLAIAFGGLRPRIEVYAIDSTPRRLWQALLPQNSGGAVETSFSSDGEWIVALTGQGRMHRMDAATGGRHLKIPSQGRSARAIPPGRIMAVAGESGAVKMWYLSDGTIAWRLPPRAGRGSVDAIAASGDGARFALLEYTDTQTIVRIFAFRKRTMLRQYTLNTLAIGDIALDDKGETLFLSHETNGLLLANVSNPAPPVPGQKRGAPRCTGHLSWHATQKRLYCATTDGLLNLTDNGRTLRQYKTPGTTDKWIVAAATEGPRIAAIGGGRLLVWWLNE